MHLTHFLEQYQQKRIINMHTRNQSENQLEASGDRSAGKNKRTKKSQVALANLVDSFSIKNFALKSSTEMFKGQLFEEPFVFSGFIFTICLKGEATIKLNHREYTMKPNSIHFYTPGQIFTLINQSDDLVLESLLLSTDYIIKLPLPKDFELLKRMDAEPVHVINGKDLNNLIELSALVTRSYREEHNVFHENRTGALVFALLMEIGSHFSTMEQVKKSGMSRQESLTDDFFKLLFESFRKERKVTFYADKLCLTPKYLSMTIKEVTGHTVSRWINMMVIIEAKKLLKVTELTALQISEELNFPNPSFFGRFFKQHTGMTPLQFRKS